MCRIPHTTRQKGRYVYRQRVHFRNIISKPVTLALRTAEPAVARQRAAILSARFAMVRRDVRKMIEEGRPLTGVEIEMIFRRELETQLAQNLHDAYENAPWSTSVPEASVALAEAYRIARRPDRPRSLSEADRAKLVERGLGAEVGQIDEYLREYCHEISDDGAAERLRALNVPVSPATVAACRAHILRAQAEAWSRSTRLFDDDVMDAVNPLQALLADLGPSPLPTVPVPEPAMAAAPAENATPERSECQFLVYDGRRFSEVIDDVLSDLRRENVWKGKLTQQRRIMETFAWITGDLPLGDYNHLHVAEFKRGLLQIPKKFKFGTLNKGAMTRPFAEVVAELPKQSDAAKRNNKTVNRDLSTMQTVSKHLAQSAWTSRSNTSLVLNFGATRITIKQRKNAVLRPPWTRHHLECLFRSPIFTGGGEALARLKSQDVACTVWHDAAYFAPMLWYYTGACREEVCGLEVADVRLDHPTPHFEICDNFTRGQDGEKAGEKREARARHLPIPPELLRLGFAKYVRAIEAEGHVPVFPELYTAEMKRGGAFFYERAWQHMVAYIGQQMPLPSGTNGKGADIHSIRSLFSSFFEVDGVNEILRADVMGHAREGTNAKHYSQRIETEGLDVVLAERLDFMTRYVPVVTAHLPATPLRLLPLNKRTRVGSPHERRSRADAGRARPTSRD